MWASVLSSPTAAQLQHLPALQCVASVAARRVGSWAHLACERSTDQRASQARGPRPPAAPASSSQQLRSVALKPWKRLSSSYTGWGIVPEQARTQHWACNAHAVTTLLPPGTELIRGFHTSRSMQAGSPPHLDFSNTQAIFQGQRTVDLVRSAVVFRLCAWPWFVRSAPILLKASNAVLGKSVTNWLVRATFFRVFCAGETDTEVLQRAKQLEKAGIGSILDYAAEDDVSAQPEPPAPVAVPPKPAGAAGFPSAPPSQEVVVDTQLAPAAGVPVEATQGAVARQYAYANEQQCDAHVAIFLSCIKAAAVMPGQGFAAVKLTGLGNPRLLERVSAAIREVRGVFAVWDTNGNGTIDRGEFEEGYHRLFKDASDEERARVFAWLDTQKDGQVDYVSWCQRLSLSRMPEYAARIQVGLEAPPPAKRSWQATLQGASLTEEEVALLRAMRGRLERIADAAAQQGVKLMIDAEHTYFQPAIDHVTLQLMKRYNAKGQPTIIYNTYQAYLQDSYQRLTLDLERARREGYVLGAKLVRGAYLDLERARAAKMGYPSPVWDTLEGTHANYARCMQELLQKVKEGRAEVLLGTHNQESIEQATAHMARLDLDPQKSPVFFGQLLGMSDHLTLVLGSAGYHAYKYVPYGLVEQVIPYLLRRAAENASVMQGTKKDLSLLESELTRRARAVFGQ